MTSFVEVWSLNLARVESTDVYARLELLSSDERMRAARFVRSEDAARYVLTRSTLRVLLGDRLGIAPSRVKISYGAQGKPRLAENRWQFNVSHSSDRALIALSETRPIGIDIESWHSFPMVDVEHGLFSPEEIARIKSAEHPVSSLFEHWTRKEAYFKAKGDGLEWSARKFTTTPRTTEYHERFCVRNVEAPTGYSAALAIESNRAEEVPSIRLWGEGDDR